MTGRAFIGISGWRYTPWRGRFYPKGLIQRLELAYAAERFDAVEINGSFYSLQRPDSYRRWADETPDDFRFAVKGGRYLTHMLRMRGTDAALGNFFGSGVLALGEKLGPILWQLPARQIFEAETLDAFLASLPRTAGDASKVAERHDEKLRHEPVLASDPTLPVQHALEPRHASFLSKESLSILRQHDVALVASDGADRWPLMRETTADFEYIRLHGAEELYASGYSPTELDTWAAEIRAHLDAGRDVHVYFDNDAKVHAPFDAIALRERLSGYLAKGVSPE